MGKVKGSKVDILDELDIIKSYLSVIKSAVSSDNYADTNDIAIVLEDVIEHINEVCMMIDL